MKKCTVTLSTLSFTVLLAACGSSGSHTPPSPTTSASMSTSQQLEAAVLPNVETTVAATASSEAAQPLPPQHPVAEEKSQSSSLSAAVEMAEQPVVSQPEVVPPEQFTPAVEAAPQAPAQPAAEVVNSIVAEAVQPPVVSQPVVVQPAPSPVSPPVVLVIQPEEKDQDPIVLPTATDNEIWQGSFARSDVVYHKDHIQAYRLIENSNASANDDPNLSEKQPVTVQLQKGRNRDQHNNYHFYLLDDNAYYGFYRDSDDMRRVDSYLVYGFNPAAENKVSLNELEAHYKGEFWYTTSSIPNVVTRSNVDLVYTKGEAKGVIKSRFGDYNLFELKTKEDPRQLHLIPSSTWLDNSAEDLVAGEESPHRIVIDLHFINAADGSLNQSIVGKGGNDIFSGVLGAEKQ